MFLHLESVCWKSSWREAWLLIRSSCVAIWKTFSLLNCYYFTVSYSKMKTKKQQESDHFTNQYICEIQMNLLLLLLLLLSSLKLCQTNTPIASIWIGLRHVHLHLLGKCFQRKSTLDFVHCSYSTALRSYPWPSNRCIKSNWDVEDPFCCWFDRMYFKICVKCI